MSWCCEEDWPEAGRFCQLSSLLGCGAANLPPLDEQVTVYCFHTRTLPFVWSMDKDRRLSKHFAEFTLWS